MTNSAKRDRRSFPFLYDGDAVAHFCFTCSALLEYRTWAFCCGVSVVSVLFVIVIILNVQMKEYKNVTFFCPSRLN